MSAELVVFPFRADHDYSIDPSEVDPPALLASSEKAREIIVELEHELYECKQVIADQSLMLARTGNVFRSKVTHTIVLVAFLTGWLLLDQPRVIRHMIYGSQHARHVVIDQKPHQHPQVQPVVGPLIAS